MNKSSTVLSSVYFGSVPCIPKDRVGEREKKQRNFAQYNWKQRTHSDSLKGG